jgi:hypothetical protein
MITSHLLVDHNRGTWIAKCIGFAGKLAAAGNPNAPAEGRKWMRAGHAPSCPGGAPAIRRAVLILRRQSGVLVARQQESRSVPDRGPRLAAFGGLSETCRSRWWSAAKKSNGRVQPGNRQEKLWAIHTTFLSGVQVYIDHETDDTRT